MTATPPIPLPRFTFLCGPPGSGQKELADALCAQDPDLTPFDLEEPLRMVVHQLFFGGYQGAELPDVLPLIDDEGHLRSVENFLEEFEEFLYNWYGKVILGELAILEYQRDGDIFPRLVYRDEHMPSLPSVRAFGNKFGFQNCLALHCGPDEPRDIHAMYLRNIWFGDVKDAAARLKILKDLPCPLSSASNGELPTTASPAATSSSSASSAVTDSGNEVPSKPAS